MEKDYSLLRPFDLDAAKAGEAICWYRDGIIAEYIGPCGMPTENDICVKYLETKGLAQAGTFAMNESRYFRMSPLCWVEGRPVYKGDVLYKQDGSKFIAKTMYSDTCILSDQPFIGSSLENLTWTPPKVKRDGWMNCYKNGENSVYPTKERADRSADYSRVACIRIEWEE